MAPAAFPSAMERAAQYSTGERGLHIDTPLLSEGVEHSNSEVSQARLSDSFRSRLLEVASRQSLAQDENHKGYAMAGCCGCFLLCFVPVFLGTFFAFAFPAIVTVERLCEEPCLVYNSTTHLSLPDSELRPGVSYDDAVGLCTTQTNIRLLGGNEAAGERREVSRLFRANPVPCFPEEGCTWLESDGFINGSALADKMRERCSQRFPSGDVVKCYVDFGGKEHRSGCTKIGAESLDRRAELVKSVFLEALFEPKHWMHFVFWSTLAGLCWFMSLITAETTWPRPVPYEGVNLTFIVYAVFCACAGAAGFCIFSGSSVGCGARYNVFIVSFGSVILAVLGIMCALSRRIRRSVGLRMHFVQIPVLLFFIPSYIIFVFVAETRDGCSHEDHLLIGSYLLGWVSVFGSVCCCHCILLPTQVRVELQREEDFKYDDNTDDEGDTNCDDAKQNVDRFDEVTEV